MRTDFLDETGVAWAYRLLLDRNPESEKVIREHIQTYPTLEQLLKGILHSQEFRKKHSTVFVQSLSGYEPAQEIDSAVSRDELNALFAHVQKTWTHLGESDPYGAVLSGEYLGANDVDTIRRFYRSGAGDLTRILATLKRNGVELGDNASVLEYGSGLGRITSHLARHFKQVIGIDISRPMIDGASSYMQENGIHNASFKLVETLDDIDNLPAADLFYSVLVLQHSPPPIIIRILRSALRSLKRGGAAIFQVPTYLSKYKYVTRDYLAGVGPEAYKRFEIHAVRQSDLFEVVTSSGADLLEIIEDNCAGAGPGSMSNTLLVRKKL